MTNRDDRIVYRPGNDRNDRDRVEYRTREDWDRDPVRRRQDFARDDWDGYITRSGNRDDYTMRDADRDERGGYATRYRNDRDEYVTPQRHDDRWVHYEYEPRERYDVRPRHEERAVRPTQYVREEEHARIVPISSFAGHGPKNYRRSDDRIREDVNEELTYHHDLDASDIDVSVNDGEVTLSGQVDSRQDKRLAEDIAERVRGVKDVHNRLKVRDRHTATRASAATPTRATVSNADDLLVKLSESDLSIHDPAADVRDRKVYDRNGDEIGHVADLLVDPDERKVRFLDVHSGGFLGMGEKRFLVPVDAVTRVQDDGVHVDQTREHVARSPQYDPNLTERRDRDYYEPYYGYYGYAPFWGGGYVYPRYPYY